MAETTEPTEPTEPTETENQVINENEIDDCKQILKNIELQLIKISQFLGA